jgi:hypothetical protein
MPLLCLACTTGAVLKWEKRLWHQNTFHQLYKDEA